MSAPINGAFFALINRVGRIPLRNPGDRLSEQD